MVSTPAAWRLPDAPASLGAQIEAAFALWVRSARAALPYSVAYTLSGLLPFATLGDLGARLLTVSGRVLWFALDPGQPDPTRELMPLVRDLQAWAISPATLVLLATAFALGLYGIDGVLLHQQRIAQGAPHAAIRLRALQRWPRALVAWVLYGVALLACAALVGVFMAALVYAALGVADLGVLALLLVVLLFGGLLSSVPLAWASVAFGYAPVLATLDGAGPLAAHRASARLVRGRWARAATVMTVPLLVYLGVGSTVSSLAYTVAGVATYAGGGLPALLDGRWLAWPPWIGAIPMALALPLAFAGMVVSLHDLRQQAQATG